MDVIIGSSLPRCSPVSTPGRKEVDPVLHKSVFEARFRARVIKDTELSAAAAAPLREMSRDAQKGTEGTYSPVARDEPHSLFTVQPEPGASSAKSND